MKLFSFIRIIGLVIALGLFISPEKVHATSASISVSGNEGAITVNASASFSAYEHCDNKKPPNCWLINSGSLRVYHNGRYLTGRSGNGNATASTVIDAGRMSQGDHTFKVIATDSKGVTQTSSTTIKIDNTPDLSVTIGDTEGDMEVGGTVDFKEVSTGSEGYVTLYLKYPNGRRYYRGQKWYGSAEPISWTWKDINGGVLDAGRLGQG
ncbi:MAG: hypothetical protein GY705_18200, partial [Bacteroidetes bacterium]|nr:hypothetical protein [Bacteroidota bacterium]